MNIVDIDKFLSQEFSQLEVTIKSLTAINKNDFAVELEDFLKPIFDIYFNTTFVNVNKEFARNFKAIDLYSKEEKIAIQITVDDTTKKKKDTLNKVADLVETNEICINELYIFVLTNKKSDIVIHENEYFKKENILNIPSLLIIERCKKEEICRYIESYYKSNFNAKFLRYKTLVNDLFVETDVLEKAMNSLDKHHIAILVGHAGTGKTLNSYKILFDYIKNGYIYIQNIEDIKYFSKNNQKYIFFSDDVISATNIADANYAEIEKAFDTASLASENLIILLNSRINIINSYSSEHSRLGLSKYRKYFIYADKLNEIEKLRITKKHFENSYDKESLLSLFNGKAFYEPSIYRIVKHKNFNPRYIENFYRNPRERNLKIAEDVLKVLENPEKIYLDAYKKLNSLEKGILEIISINNGRLKRAKILERFNLNPDYEIEEAVANLDKSFLLQAELNNREIFYEFYNPSIQDFCNMIVDQSPEINQYFTVDGNVKTIQRLLGNQRIPIEEKLNVIDKHPDKESILQNARDLNQNLFESFTEELTSIFVESGSIPYFYLEILDDETKISIEDKYPFTKRDYISPSGYLSDSFLRMIRKNSTDIFRSDVKDKIKRDYLRGIDDYITQYIIDTYIDSSYEESGVYPFEKEEILNIIEAYKNEIISEVVNEVEYFVEDMEDFKYGIDDDSSIDELSYSLFDFSGDLKDLCDLLKGYEQLQYYRGLASMLYSVLEISEEEIYGIATDYFDNTYSDNSSSKSDLEIEVDEFEKQVNKMVD